MNGEQKGYLFEVSWEVCNKVGGIYTVISSKVREALRHYGDRYILLGPDLKNHPDFEETDEEGWNRIREGTAIKDIPCRFGRWRIPGEPKAILVGFGKKYNKDQLLFRIWEDYGVDSIAGGWDYVEPVMFSYACGEVIETIYNLLARPQNLPAVAHFHEWMCGAGLLCLKKRLPEVGTVFTTHATILGRTLAGSGVNLHQAMEHISPQKEASAHNITAKFSMEAASAREAGCFTTVSDITAQEAKNLLGRLPDVITPNGLDMEQIPDLAEDRTLALGSRERLLDAARKFLKRDFPPSTRIILLSGRYEFRNKGIDLFLNALGRLDKEWTGDSPILACLFVLGGHMDLLPFLQSDFTKADSAAPPIATHRLHYGASDPILETCNRLGLKNLPQNRVQVIFNPAYLDGQDGLINMPYYEALAGCDLGVFPSFYEPWGYTPEESSAYAVPTVTTDMTGFGLWVRQSVGPNDGVIVLDRQDREPSTVEDTLYEVLKSFLSWTEAEVQGRRRSARRVALKADWRDFYGAYIQAYNRSLAVARDHTEKMALQDSRAETRHVFSGIVSTQPHFRSFTAVANLPERIARLRELAYNLWWSWNPKALDLFITLDPKIWPDMANNPVKMLETVSRDRLAEAAENASYMAMYTHTLQQFDDYLEDRTPSRGPVLQNGLKWSSPVAYFSAEYGIHESLPLYSGGLGTLSGDHLKTASDLNLPLVAVGILYKCGYFRQVIDRNGIQIAEYPESDFSSIPVQIVQDDRGDEVQISLDLPGRTLFANIWEVRIGRVTLYLLDTDVPRNTLPDRKITERLYCADQRTRLEQEILLGMGGVKLLKKLGIKPAVYHINEGHSAFLLFERIQDLMTDEGLSFDEAVEVVRGSTVFTTHTPVEAGNERFGRELMEHYFAGFVKRTGMSWSQFWELGRKESGEERPFFMNILALKMSNRSNAVSLIHGQVARHMWRDVWKGFHDTDIPIGHVTNGVHVMSYIAPAMRELLDTYLGMDWDRHLTDPDRWARVSDIPDTLLWRTRYEIKQKTTDFLRDNLSRQGLKYGYDTQTWREELFSKMNPTALMIGFARRFAPYKRADLLLSNLDRLDRILNNPGRPVQVVYAGKAHPNDEMGKNLLKKVVDICRDPRFRGKIFFLDDYNIQTARQLVQGVDVWLNTPRRPLEASGTSGQKVAVNGVLNLSISDGWWIEGYDGTNGWTIGPVVKSYLSEPASADEEDGQSLYALLENTVIPMFYDRELSGIPERWIAMVKRSLQTLVPRFNTERMLKDYLQDLYLPAAARSRSLDADQHRLARTLADWKRKIPMRFSSLKLLEIGVEGIHGDTILVDQPLRVSARVDPGKLSPDEILVELMIGEKDGRDFAGVPACLPLAVERIGDDGVITFAVEHTVEKNGQYGYGVRVIPRHRDLSSREEAGLILWG